MGNNQPRSGIPNVPFTFKSNSPNPSENTNSSASGSLSVPSLVPPLRAPSPSVPSSASLSSLSGTNVVTIVSAASVLKPESQPTEAELSLKNVKRFVSLEKANLFNLQLSSVALLEVCRVYQCHIRATAHVFATNQTHLRNWMRRSSEISSKHVSGLGNHFSTVRKFETQMGAIELIEKQVVQIKKNVVDVVRMATRLNNLLPPQDRLPTLYLVDLRNLKPMGS